MNETSVHTPKKRGPKPIGDAPMTAAERKRRSRAHQVAKGTRAEFMISLSGGLLDFVNQMAVENEVSRSKVVQELLEMAIRIVHGTAEQANRMLAEGATQDEIESLMRKAFTAPKPQPAHTRKEEAPTK